MADLFDLKPADQPEPTNGGHSVTTTLPPQAVATRPNMLPATDGFGIEGLEGLGQQDMVLPRKSIIQPISEKEGTRGQFYDNISGESVAKVVAVILRISHGATKWSADLSNKTPECRSYDGVTGTAHGACNRCQFNAEANAALWELRGDEAKAKRCNRGYELLCADTADDTMFLLSARGMSVKPLKTFITALVKKRKSPFAVQVGLEADKKSDSRGNYYVLNLDIIKDLTIEETALYREQAVAMRDIAIREVDEGEPAAGGNGVEEGALGDGVLPPF
jgi:hypothetical protein